jgi:hypothetical protein
MSDKRPPASSTHVLLAIHVILVTTLIVVSSPAAIVDAVKETFALRRRVIGRLEECRGSGPPGSSSCKEPVSK